jgi:DNA-binding transcriptional LysR family regulator
MAGLDLNLLRIFLVLWDERSVSRAAAKVNITQPAMSHSLKRLRSMLKDELFDRSTKGLTPTLFAASLEPRLRRALREVEIAVEPHEFDSLTSDREYVIATGPHNATILIPPIVEAAKDAAPNIKMKVVQPGSRLGFQIESGAVDVAIGVFDHWPASVDGKMLYLEDIVWIGRSGLVFDPPISDNTLRGMMRVDVITSELERIGNPNPIQFKTTSHPQQGQVTVGSNLPPWRAAEIVVYDYRTAMEIVARSDMVAMLPRSAVMRYGDAFGVHIIAKDIVRSNSITMIWSRHRSEMPDHQWFRGLIEHTVASVSRSIRLGSQLPD